MTLMIAFLPIIVLFLAVCLLFFWIWWDTRPKQYTDKEIEALFAYTRGGRTEENWDFDKWEIKE